MKHILYFILFFMTVGVFAAPSNKAYVALYPTTAAVGDTVEYTVSLPGTPEGQLRLPQLTGATWVTNQFSRQTQIINGKTTFSFTIPILPQKEGTLVIPAWSVSVDKQNLSIPEQEIRIVAASQRPVASPQGEKDGLTLDQAIFGKIMLLNDRTKFYVGEEIPLEIQVNLMRGFQARLRGYPELDGLKNAIFNDYSKINQQSRTFAPIRQRSINHNGSEYLQLIFSTSFKITVPGALKISGTLPLELVEQRKTPRRHSMDSLFDDDFFSFNRATYRPYNVPLAPAPELTIAPLPQTPAGVLFLGLVGEWKISAAFDRSEVKVGEPVTLLITAEGVGAVDGIKPPKLDIPGMRVYPPEQSKENAGARRQLVFKYALIPLKEMTVTPDLRLASFNPISGDYSVVVPALKLTVLPGEKTAPAAVFNTPTVTDTETKLDDGLSKQAPREELFYQKANPGNTVKLPLIRNQIFWLLLFLIGGPFAAVILEYTRRKRLRKQTDPAYARRLALRQQYPELKNKLRNAIRTPEEFQQLLHESVTPFLAEALQLPPGATPAEVAEKLTDPQLRELFESCGKSGFCPGAEVTPRIPITSVLLDKLLTTLKRSLVIFGIFILFAESSFADNFNAAFDKGDFKTAIQEYRQRLTTQAPAPNVLYNLGGAYFRVGDLPMARYCFLRAHLLAPRDAEILENLNLVNRKLVLPEIGNTDTPAGVLNWCRDRLRPDQYIVLAAFFFALLCIGAALRQTLGRNGSIAWYSTFGGLLFLALTIAWSQSLGPYNTKAAIITAKQAELRTLPTTGSSRVSATIPGGSAAWILDRRDNWVRIEVNGQDGWVQADRIKTVFPEGIL